MDFNISQKYWLFLTLAVTVGFYARSDRSVEFNLIEYDVTWNNPYSLTYFTLQ